MAKDPFKYFRIEARELLSELTRELLELEKGSRGPEPVAKLLRLAHTLKGAARVVKLPGIAELAHKLEDGLSPLRENGSAIAPGQTTAFLACVDAIATHVAAVDAPAKAADGPHEPIAGAIASSDERFEAVRVELSEMDALLDEISELGSKLASVRGGAAALQRTQRDLLAGMDSVARGLEQVHETASRLRLLPVSAVFGTLERVARDSAQELGRRVDFAAAGGDVRLDAHVLSAVREALVQLVRNAVAHGIEREDERLAAGKAPAGNVRVAVSRDGHRVRLTVSDDGRGIDVEAVRRVALRRGLLSTEEATNLSVGRAFELLFRGGVSTARTITEMSGRGVGLDVVRDVVSRFKGEAVARSEPGCGATIDLSVPVSVASLAALRVEAAGARLLLPLDGVVGALRVLERDVAHTDHGESIAYEGTSIPIVAFAELHGAGAKARTRGASTAVVIRAGNGQAAIGVDRLLGIEQVVVRTLPSIVEAAPLVAGAALDTEGNPQVVLDPFALVEAARAPRARLPELPTERRLPVLVVDDSLTTRMLEQSILESAGYEVDLATSGEQALDKARERRYEVFVVDVEMPGMDGFEFVARTRVDPLLREIPAVLVTSRGSPADRRRGLEAGARAYIVKSEFDEGRLLTTIRDLVGARQ
jgi:two-component system chemotaxis sensor kinase CheA